MDFYQIERDELLRAVDRYWIDHIDAMDQLRKGIGLRGYAQQDPVIAYKEEGHEMFDEMIERIQTTTITRLLKGRIVRMPANMVQGRQAPAPRPMPTPTAKPVPPVAPAPKPVDGKGNFVPEGTPIHRPKN